MGLGADLADFAAAALKFRAETRALIGLKSEAKEGSYAQKVRTLISSFIHCLDCVVLCCVVLCCVCCGVVWCGVVCCVVLCCVVL